MFRIRTIPCLALPHLPTLSKVRCCRPKKFGRLPEGLFPIRTNPPKPALSLAPHHVLASLVKGRWLDGKAQALILLLSVCDTPTFFYLSNFSAVKTEGLLYTHQPLHSRNHCKRTIIPRSAPRPCLPSKKGRWLDGIAKPLFYIIFIL